MRHRTRILTALCLLAVAGAWMFWPHGHPQKNEPVTAPVTVAAKNSTAPVASIAPHKLTTLNTNALAFRLANTKRSLHQLEATPHAILLANAFIDTDEQLDLKIPTQLHSTGDPGAYIVQARGIVDANFRATLAAVGAQIVSYIPNNAYLVRVTAGGAGALSANALVQTVLPYEPYYKVQSSLLGLAVNEQPLPPGTALNLGLFAADAAATEQQIENLGAKIIGRDRSPFGPVLRVLAPDNWIALAQVPGVQIMEPAHERHAANDLSRVTVGISTDTLTSTNYLNLDGHNVLVAVNDSGIDETHPDLTGRVFGLNPIDLVDTNGHGTFVAGIIAGSGVSSTNPVDVGAFAEGSIPGANFRGKAPMADLFSVRNDLHSDYVLQRTAALTNALISNNSWNYGTTEYDLAAASYDAATRDAVPGDTGSQPMLFVFPAGNSGGGADDGSQGSGDTILSPGTAKNVITVGSLEQLRNITNIVTDANSNTSAYWQSKTDSGNQVAFDSSRGNVGIGTEGSYGRFKPDVVSPGVFVVSTRSSQWDTNSYYNPTNVATTTYTDQLSDTNAFVYYSVDVPPNAIGVYISISPNNLSPSPFPNLIIYARQAGYPTATTYDIKTDNNVLAIPPNSGGAISGLQAIQGNGFSFAVADSTNFSVNYNLTVQVLTTNNVGNRYQVLEEMNETLAPWYRYESGTSLAAADVSGVLALIEDYFTNTLQVTPSPALLKALLINGARSVGNYGLAVTNTINFQGWGLDDIQASVPDGGIISAANTPGSSFYVDQSPTNALATGDSHTYFVSINTNEYAQYLNLQATLVWTDPPGDPAAAIKLVNNLDLVITNLDTGDVYFGNDISTDIGFNEPWNTNNPPNLDTINNVENILLPALLAGNYSVTVVGRSVNVNAVTAQINNPGGQYAPNIVQDYALVVSVGEGELTNAFTVTDPIGIVSNPTGDQNITIVTSTNSPLFNQIAGANSPLLGTNTIPLGTNTAWGPSGVLTVGMTNQWHFYIVTNTGPKPDYTNAAFILFDSSTLSLPRMGVYEDTVANATRPEADIDLYVSPDGSLTNLDPVAISNCLAGVNNSRASLGQGGTEFVFYTNSVSIAAGAPSVYYVGVKSEDHMAAQYAFLPVFSETPFSQLDKNGNQIVNGLLLPTGIPDGNNAHPGVTNVFALAVIPMDVEKVTVTNLDEHQNFGDLFGALTFGGQHVVLNNHDGFGNTIGAAPIVYDDSRNHVAGTTNSDGPGSLVDFRAKSALGPWILGEMDNSLTMTGQVSAFQLLIQPHRDLTGPGVIVAVPPGGWFIDYVDVPAGYTNLTYYGTNVTVPVAADAIQMYEKLGNDPTLTDYDQRADLTNGTPPGNIISVGPPLPFGRYFVGLYNPNTTLSQNVFLRATLGVDLSSSDLYNFTASSGQPLLDDAVTPVPPLPNPATPGSSISVAATQQVASVNVGLYVNSPRISDYTFTLVSPTGQRVLLMENRGGGDTNGAGEEFVYTNVLNSTATGGAAASTNNLSVDPSGGSVPITYNFYTVQDEMMVYEGTNVNSAYLIYDTGFTNNPPGGPGAQNTIPVTINVPYQPGFSNIIIIMNQFGNPYASGGDAWIYTAGAPATNYQYLVFTDDTNLTSVPIKFAQPPFDFTEDATNYILSDFELATNGNYFEPASISDLFGGWSVPTNIVTYSSYETNAQFVTVTNVETLTNNLVSVVTDPADSLGDNVGSNFLALANGTITRSIETTPGRIYNVTFWYRGPGIQGWWRGEGNGSDSSDPENNNNNGTLIGRFNFPAGEVDQALQFEDPGNPFQFAATNTYMQIPASPSLNVGAGGGFTLEGWINPTNLSRPQPLVEWLAHVPTNTAITNIVIVQGPILNRATDHYYYLLGATNWATSELWAEQLGGHLVDIGTANEENWVYDTFTDYGMLNRNLWIGLTNSGPNTPFNWSDGSTNVAYTNWMPGQPIDCGGAGTERYVAITGPTNTLPGLWKLEDNLGLTCDAPPTNLIYGVVEVSDIPTNGVQFWISGTNNTPGGTNLLAGCLYANIVDTNYVSHEIFSAPGLLMTNIYQHVAVTYDTNSGIAALYLNGTNVATTNFGTPFIPKTDGDMLLGMDMTRYTNNYYGGTMDEMSLYSRALSLAEISAIYHVSADTTNRLIGKFDPAVTPAAGLAEALVTFGVNSNIIFGVNNKWEVNSYTFTATTDSIPLTISGIEPGILLDTFSVSEAPLTNLYYLPEEALESFNGESVFGDWTLQVWDNRVGAYITNVAQLASWQLSFVLESNAVVSASLPPETPVTTSVSSGNIVYYSVTVPTWATSATNILVSSTLPVDLLFNQTNPPTGSNPGDITMLTGQTSGIGLPILVTNGTPPLLPGQTYYLGVRNPTGHTATVTLEVDYDILALTNDVAYDSLLNTNDALRYFSFDVSSNAYEATFQLLKLSSNADLVVSKGVPLPTLNDTDYGSYNVSNIDENIFVLTNSEPIPLSAGRWYLGVIKRDSGVVKYSVLAKELDLEVGMTNIIDLTNDVPFTWTAGPGAALTNFFRFHATNSVVGGTNYNLQALRFELYNLTGNGDLTVQTNALPLSPPFFQTSQNGGSTPELIYVSTNSVLTNLAADWYLGVPNRETRSISYTIVAEIETNSYFPAFPDAQGVGGGTLGAGHAGMSNTVYHVTTTSDSGPGSLRDAVNSTNRTVIFDISGAINLASPLVITNSYLTIAGQTAPGGGITVAGYMTIVQSAHDVIIRDVRFRRGSVDDSLMFTNVANVIADHVSAEWSSDNNMSVLNSSNVTVQWSIMADSLYLTNNPPATGSLLRYGSGGLSFHHNLYADNYSGSPRLGDNLTLDFVNNVIYNWGFRSGLTGGTNDFDISTDGCTNQLNYICNYLIAGPDTARFATNDYNITNIAYFGGVTNALAANWVFQTNNFIDSDTNGVLNGSDTGWGMFTNQYTRFSHPFATTPVPIDEAFIAYERVLDFAGVNLTQRDPVDQGIANGVRTQTGTLISASSMSGLIAWWPGEGNGNDIVGTNNCILSPDVTFGPGLIGQGFYLNDTNAYLTVPASASLDVGSRGKGFTLEAWIYPTNVNAFHLIMEWEQGYVGGGNIGVQFWLGSQPSDVGVLFANLTDVNNNIHLVKSSQNAIVANKFQHVALTYDPTSGNATLYINGVVAAQQNLGSFIPQTSYNLFFGTRQGDLPGAWTYGSFFGGIIDEPRIYKRALSQAEIVSIYNTDLAGKTPAASALAYLDTDQDGIPDFWEDTFTTNLVFTPSNNNDRDGDGYTDLEEFDNWLAVPHALTVTNTPVGVDLYQLCGESGHLAFFVTNSIHGFVYLTNVLGSVTNTTYFSNSFAIFTPTNNLPFTTNYNGYASFDLYVTNLDTSAYFGPVTVSVIVSAVPILYANNTNTPPVLATNIPDQTVNELTLLTVTNTATDGNTNLTLTYTVSLSIDTNAMLANGWPLTYVSTVPAPVISTNGIIMWTPSETQGPGVYIITTVVSDGELPPLTATNSFQVTVNEVNSAPFWPMNVPSQTNYDISALAPLLVTNTAVDSDIPPNPLSYQLIGPAGAMINTNGIITWTPTEAQVGLYTFTTIVTDTNVYVLFNRSLSATNVFTVLVTSVFPPPPTNETVNELTLLTVTNTATDGNTNLTLTYTVSLSIDTNAMLANGWPLTYVSTVPAPVISTNGIIMWTPSETQGPGVYIITTVVSDGELPPLTATNSFQVTVNEVNSAPFWPTNVPSQTNYDISALAPLLVTNTAVDSDIPPNPLSYQLIGPAGAMIDTNGIITWTPTEAQVGLYTFTTIVTDTNVYVLFNRSLSATNVFTVFVIGIAPPFAFTQPAQGVTGTSAQLNGMATPNGQASVAWFEWGTNTSYGNQTPSVNVGSGYNVAFSTAQITGLITNIPYHFRLVASNALGVTYGFDQILDEARVVAWGADYAGQADVPVGLSNVVAIAGAYDHSLALKNNGTAAVWGDNTFGQATVPAGLNNLVALAGGAYYSLALKNNGTVVTWGANILNQTNVPPGLNNVVAIAGGTYSSLALRSNGSVVVWGANFFNLTNLPAGLSNVVAIAGGSYHNLAVKNNGTVTAWGDDSANQTDVPPNLTNVVAIAGGGYHSLALRSDGTVAAWGDDSAGQTNVPPGLTNVIAIAAGGFHSMALLANGQIVTWGDNTAGQISVPVGLTNVVAIASGYLHSLALTPFFNVNPTNPIVLNITNDIPDTNSIGAGGVIYYQVNVPTNADFATNTLLFALNGPLNIWFTTNLPPTIGGTNDSLLLAGVTNGSSILSTVSMPTNIVPGMSYYLGVNNTNSFSVNYGIEVDFHESGSNVSQTNTIPVSDIIYTNGGYLLTWFAPSNDLFQVQFTDELVPANWITFTNVISYNTNAFTDPTNTQFNFFDDGVQYPFVGTRFYRLILLGSTSTPNTPPILPTQVNLVVNPLNLLIVTNTAVDLDLPAQTLTYSLTSTVTGTNLPIINTNGIITWTPDVSQAGPSNVFTTIVTDDGTPNLSATNTFSVIVNPVPDIGNVIYTNGVYLLTWLAPTNDIFRVQLTDSLSPANWQSFSNLVTYTGPVTPTNGLFYFIDDGSQYPFTGLRFYRLILVGVTTPIASSNTAPMLPLQTTQIANPLTPFIVTNTATDSGVPAQLLTYTLSSTVTGTNLPVINTNGIITWTPDVSQAGTSNVFTTIVTDDGTPNLSATNTFSVIVNPVPDIGNVIYTNGVYLLTWLAPTNDIFRVQLTDSLSPANWQSFSNLVTYTGPVTPTNGLFYFIDDGSQYPFTGLRFYRLILVGVTTTIASSNTAPMLPPQTTQIANPLTPFIITNTAADSDVPAQLLTYTLSSTVTGTNLPIINTNGIITWTPDVSQAGTSNVFTTIVTDDGSPNSSATNIFSVIVNPIPTISDVIFTNNGFLLEWYAPTNDRFQLQWTASLVPVSWHTFTNIITYTGPVISTNGLFTFFDDGSQTGGFGQAHFYNLLLLGSTINTLTLPAQTNLVISLSSPVIVTNTAVDSNPNATLSYSLLNPPIGAVISTNGVITWSSATPSGIAARFTTVVTDDDTPPLTASNSFTIFVMPFPAITNVTVTATNVVLNWSAPTNDIFQVQWTTNLAPVATWFTFPELINSGNGLFTFTDTNAPLVMKFYRLWLLP